MPSATAPGSEKCWGFHEPESVQMSGGAMPIVKTLLINLDGSDERLDSAVAQIKAAGVEYERYSAFDGRGRKAAEFSEYDDDRAVGFYGRPMTGGEMGCYFSHLGCAEAFLKSDATYGLVLEDDVLCHPDSFKILDEIIAWLEESGQTGWDMINLCMTPKKFTTKLADFSGESGDYELVHAHYFPVTTTAILWSRDGAERFWATRNEIYAPLDHFFRRWLSQSGRGLGIKPELFWITGAESDLDSDGGAGLARRRVARTPAYFWSEFKRQSVNYLSALWHMLRHRISGS